MLNVPMFVRSRVAHADPIGMALLDQGGTAEPALGVFPREDGLGFLPVVPAIIAAYRNIRLISDAVGKFGVGGGSSSPAMRDIYQQIPQSAIRVTGGHGTWTDTLTGETMRDLATEVRKSAMLANAVGVFVNPDNWYFDDTTGQHVSPETVRARWDTMFGAGASFQSAYAKMPQVFRTWGTDASLDPIIVNAPKAEQVPPLHPDLRAGAQFKPLPGAPVADYTPPVSYTPPGQTHPTTAAPGGPVLAGLSGTTIAVAIGATVLLAMFAARKTGR